MINFIKRKLSPGAVLEPFLAYLVATDEELPDIGVDPFEVLEFVYIHPPLRHIGRTGGPACPNRLLVRAVALTYPYPGGRGADRPRARPDVADLLDNVIAADGVYSDEIIERWRFHEVERDQLGTFLTECAEKIEVGCERQSREVDLQELGITGPVCGGVEGGVGVLEDILRGQSLVTIMVGQASCLSFFHRLEACATPLTWQLIVPIWQWQPQFFAKASDKFRVQVRTAPLPERRVPPFLP